MKEQGVNKWGPECDCLLESSGPAWTDMATSVYQISSLKKTAFYKDEHFNFKKIRGVNEKIHDILKQRKSFRDYNMYMLQ